ncbi:MAG TPA: DUF116 domain-containing protein [Malonomonas sp.]
MSSQTVEPTQPRKRLFILLLGGACGLILGMAFLLWWVPSIGLENIHPALPVLFGVLLGGIALVTVGGLTLLILTLLTGRDLFITDGLRKLVVKYLFPAIISIGRLVGIDRDQLRKSFIVLNNQLVEAKKLRVPAERTLILLPHCIQMFDCAIKITGDVEKCVHCGKCDISGLLKLANTYGIDMAVATGGTLARKLIVDKRPKLIVAVACERDLTSGIRDSYPLPVIGVLNERPHGPCFNTHILLPEVEKALQAYVIPKAL